MSQRQLSPETVEKINDKLARISKGEKRSAASGSTQGISVSGTYVSIDNWQAVFNGTDNADLLWVSATITSNSGAIDSSNLFMFASDGQLDAYSVVSGTSDTSLQMLAGTQLAGPNNPGTIISTITGSVGGQPFHYSYPLDVYTYTYQLQSEAAST